MVCTVYTPAAQPSRTLANSLLICTRDLVLSAHPRMHEQIKAAVRLRTSALPSARFLWAWFRDSALSLSCVALPSHAFYFPRT